jgi:hypothetical protein
MKNTTPYPILDPSSLGPREEIELVPDDKMNPLDKAMITNLRRGVKYRMMVADTLPNRAALCAKAMYIQMVAYKEGWAFDPEKLQVAFVEPEIVPDRGDHKESRIFGREAPGKPKNYSLGYRIYEDEARRMEPDESIGIAGRVNRFFDRLRR